MGSVSLSASKQRLAAKPRNKTPTKKKKRKKRAFNVSRRRGASKNAYISPSERYNDKWNISTRKPAPRICLFLVIRHSPDGNVIGNG